MRDYFLEQSFGKFAIEGDAYGWFTVDKPEAYYGDDNPAGGEDNLLPGHTAGPACRRGRARTVERVDWLAYRQLGLRLRRPDTSPTASSITRSSSTPASTSPVAAARRATTRSGRTARPLGAGGRRPTGAPALGYTIIYNYTIMPEDGGVGVFAHEFAPRSRAARMSTTPSTAATADSRRSGRLQSTGSWVGKPAQTQPADMSIWAKYALGWVGAG